MLLSTSQPTTQIFKQLFLQVHLHGAIDFAEAAGAVLEAWLALHLSLTFSRLSGTNPASHIATHHAAFSASAFCKVQLILRCCGCGVFPIRHNHNNPCD